MSDVVGEYKMAESVGVSFVDESDFQKEGKWYILSNNSQFEVCSTVCSDINGSGWWAYQILAKMFIVSVGNGQRFRWYFFATRTVIIIRNPRHQKFLHPSIEKSRIVVILYSRDSNYKPYNYYKVAGETCWINISAMSGNATLLNKYSFLEWTFSLEFEWI